MYQYKPIRQILYNKHIGFYKSYGIECLKDGILITTVSDVSTDVKALKKLTSLMNCGQLEPVHLKDVIEDFLT